MNRPSQSNQSFELSEESQSIQIQLSAKIRQKIEQQNEKIPFSLFMQMALYEPQLGYYQNNLHKFGSKGDFITAPEMGDSFGLCLANSLSDLLAKDNPSGLKKLLEIGAGSGRLAASLLTHLKSKDSLPEDYFILEPSAELQAQQKSLLQKNHPDIIDRIIWLSKLPERFEGVIIANEVIDAIPFERMVYEKNQWWRMGVKSQPNEFTTCLFETLGTESLPATVQANMIEELYCDGYQTEYRPLADGWIKSLSLALEVGAILLIDYGYSDSELYHPQRHQGSMQCFINHHAHSDGLKFVGLQDITAHVNFTQIAQSAHDNQLSIDGYTTQAGFLLENGIMEINDALAENDESRYRRSQELQKLLMPGQMGEVIKVMSLSKNLDADIDGFSLQDHMHRL